MKENSTEKNVDTNVTCNKADAPSLRKENKNASNLNIPIIQPCNIIQSRPDNSIDMESINHNRSNSMETKLLKLLNSPIKYIQLQPKDYEKFKIKATHRQNPNKNSNMHDVTCTPKAINLNLSHNNKNLETPHNLESIQQNNNIHDVTCTPKVVNLNLSDNNKELEEPNKIDSMHDLAYPLENQDKVSKPKTTNPHPCTNTGISTTNNINNLHDLAYPLVNHNVENEPIDSTSNILTPNNYHSKHKTFF
ncbi:MAG: hypothetical protein AAFP20_25130 [Cyanobacteria bacterium J06614_10]